MKKDIKKVVYVIFVLIVLSSCGKKLLFFDEKNNYIIIDKNKYVLCNYKSTKVIGSDSEYKFTIFNTHDKNMNVFSTVLENTSMFYSTENYKSIKSKIIFDSYYPNFMKHAIHSGIKKFNFIIIPPHDSLVININPTFVNDYKRSELKYYYFISNEESDLLNIEKLNLIDSTENIFP